MTLWNIVPLSIIMWPPLPCLDMCERQSHVRAEKLMDELVTFLSLHMGPQQDVSPIQQLIPVAIERRGGCGLVRNKMWLFRQIQKCIEENCISSLLYCPTYSDCQTSSALSALLNRQEEIVRLNNLQLFDRPYFASSSFSLTVNGYSFLFYTLSLHSLASVAFSILLNLYFIHSSQTDARYTPVVFSSCLINGVLNHSAVLSLPFVSPQFFLLLLLIFFLEILSIMLFFIYQDEVRHLDSSHCVYPVIFPS